MKKLSLLLLSTFLIVGCNKSDFLFEQEQETVKTKSIYPGELTGETAPTIFKSENYTLSMKNPTTEKDYEVTIKANQTGKVLLTRGGLYSQNSLKTKLTQGTKDFEFQAFWTNKADSNSPLKLSVYYSNNILGELSITPQDSKMNMAKSGSLYIGGTIKITTTPLKDQYSDIQINGAPVWTYDKNIFSLITSNNSNTECSITLRAIAETKSTTISVNAPIKYTYRKADGEPNEMGSVNTNSIGTTTFAITSSFNINTDSKIVCPEGSITATMPNLANVSGATVNWKGGTGLTLASGQGSGTAVFKANSSFNGTTSIVAETTYNGKTYTSNSNSIWIGKPIITNTTDQFTIENRNIAVTITPTANGLDSTTPYQWTIESGNASITTSQEGVATIKSLAPNSSTDNIIVSLAANNSCGTTKKTFNISVLESADYISHIQPADGAYVDIPVLCKDSNHILCDMWLQGTVKYSGVRYIFNYDEWVSAGKPEVSNSIIQASNGVSYTVRIYVN